MDYMWLEKIRRRRFKERAKINERSFKLIRYSCKCELN